MANKEQRMHVCWQVNVMNKICMNIIQYHKKKSIKLQTIIRLYNQSELPQSNSQSKSCFSRKSKVKHPFDQSLDTIYSLSVGIKHNSVLNGNNLVNETIVVVKRYLLAATPIIYICMQKIKSFTSFQCATVFSSRTVFFFQLAQHIVILAVLIRNRNLMKRSQQSKEEVEVI